MKLHAPTALMPDGWGSDVLVELDDEGVIVSVTAGVGTAPDDAERLDGPLLPGMPNLHSHAFQRAMAGLAEARGPTDDSFWTWRRRMYAFVERVSPEQANDIAAQLYVEMLRAGYTSVGEFHYLHHQPDGRAYATPSEVSDQVIAAAREVGIAITHLPVLYTSSGFGGVPPGVEQRRFVHDSDEFTALVEGLIHRYRDDPLVRIGIAPHSLRAVTAEQLVRAVGAMGRRDATAPIHIHIAEQIREVDECIAWSGKRPVEWLLDQVEVGERWCLVHATHTNDDERSALAESRAVVGLCPSTEANLGDGLFAARKFLDEAGRIGIGSDSNVTVSPGDELRLLEYGQRLFHQRRAILATASSPSVGRTLYDHALRGGAQALAQPVGALRAGCRADLLVLDPDAACLAQKSGDRILDSLVFAGDRAAVKHVMVAGRWRVRDGHHPLETAIYGRYRRALAALLE